MRELLYRYRYATYPGIVAAALLTAMAVIDPRSPTFVYVVGFLSGAVFTLWVVAIRLRVVRPHDTEQSDN